MAKIPCTLDTYRRQKKCMKIIFTIDEKDCGNLAALLDMAMDKPLLLDLITDVEKQRKQLLQITGEQRSKIFALVKDVSEYTGNDKESQRQELMEMYCIEREVEMFSLSDCMADTAGDFINWLIEFAFEHGVALSENPISGLDDIESYIRLCISKKKCCCCGKDGSVYKFDDDNYISLCDTHKLRLGKIGKEAFYNEFHVKAVKK